MRTRSQASAEPVAVDSQSEGGRSGRSRQSQKRRASSIASDADEALLSIEAPEQATTPEPKPKRQRRSRGSSSRASEQPSDVSSSNSVQPEPEPEPEAEQPEQIQNAVNVDTEAKHVRFDGVAPLTPPTSSPPTQQSAKTGTGVMSYFRNLIMTPLSAKPVTAHTNHALLTPSSTTSPPTILVNGADPELNNPLGNVQSRHLDEMTALRRRQNQEIRQRFDTLRDRYTKLEKVSFTLDAELDQKAKAILDLENTIEELEKSKADDQEAIEQLDAMVADYDIDYAFLEHRSKEAQKERDEEIASLNEVLANQTTKVGDLESALQEAGQEANKLKMKLWEAQQLVQAGEKNYERMEHLFGKELEKKDNEHAQVLHGKDAHIAKLKCFIQQQMKKQENTYADFVNFTHENEL